MTTWRVTTSTVTFAHDELLKYHRARVDQTADAQDMLSETWLAAGRLFEKRSSLRNYLYAIARSLVSQNWRARGRRLSPSDAADDCPTDLPGQDEWLIAHRNHELAEKALETFPDRRAVALWLMGYNSFEIAAELRVTYHTACSRLARGEAAICGALNDAAGSSCGKTS